MRVSLVLILVLTVAVPAADLESRAMTHYIPQDFLETIVRKEGWTEIVLKPYGGVRKGDFARIWSGGMIDRGNGDRPGINVNGPSGLETGKIMPTEANKLALSAEPQHGFALLFKSDDGKVHKSQTPGKPLEIPLKENGKLFIGFNDLKGQYNDNHLGKGRRYELDPAWVRVEIIRIVTD